MASCPGESFLGYAVSKLEMSRADVPAQITVYTLPWCVHCARAKALLRRRGLAFHEIDGSGVPDFRRQLAGITGGFTVPQIVIDGEAIGGADRLAALDRLGVLIPIARGEQFPIVREVKRISPCALFHWAAARVHGHRDVSPFRRSRVRLDRTGRVVGTDDAADAKAQEEEQHGEGLCRIAR